jgi:hypothetical protein
MSGRSAVTRNALVQQIRDLLEDAGDVDVLYWPQRRGWRDRRTGGAGSDHDLSQGAT